VTQDHQTREFVMQCLLKLLPQSLSKKIVAVPSWLRASSLLLVCLSLLLSGAQPALAGLLEDLTDGQHVLLMRHADAPGVGDPASYKLDQCATQRNLGEVGRQQSVLIGRWLSSQGVTNPKLFSSAWCRCVDTGRLLALGSVTVEPSLNSFFDDMSLATSQTASLQRFITASLKAHPKQPLILVTHHVNIQSLTGRVVSVGDMVLVRVRPDGSHVSHQVFPSPRP
jgi:phosphohistidine phosphatase SixA